MLKVNGLYQIQPKSLIMGDVIFCQDEVVEVLKLKGINVMVKRLNTGEIEEVSAQGLEFAVEKIG